MIVTKGLSSGFYMTATLLYFLLSAVSFVYTLLHRRFLI